MVQAGVSANRLELLQIADAVAREKSIDRKIVIQAMEDAIQKAAKQRYGQENDIRCSIDPRSGETRLTRVVTVAEEVENESQQMTLDDARRKKPDAAVGDTFVEQLPPLDFGRVAAQNAKQVIFQKVREAERDRQYEEFKDRVGEIVNGTVKRVEYGNIIVDLGRGEGIMRRDQSIPRENVQHRRPHPHLHLRRPPRAKGPQIMLSRAKPDFMAKLFAQEVPEVYDGVDRDPRRRPRSRLARQDGGPVERQLDRSRRRLRRHARLARPGGRRRTAGREDRHHPVEPGRAAPSSSTPWLRPKSPRSCSTRKPTASRWSCRTSSCRWPSAAAARTSAWPRS